MLRVIIFAGLFGLGSMAFAQAGGQPFQPAVPAAPSFSGGGWYGGGNWGGGTVEGSMMQGMASVISAKGNYNLATSAAAVNLSQAEKQAIQNRVQAVSAYYETKEMYRAAAASRRSPRLSQEQLVRLSAQAAPRALDANQVNPVSGQVAWPELLQSDKYKQDRDIVEQVLAKQASFGRLGLADNDQFAQAIDRMSGLLREDISKVTAQDYVTAKNFLKSMLYGVTKRQLS